jgi:hypothetical protein
MTSAHCHCNLHSAISVEPGSAVGSASPTAASLGLRVRLIPVDRHRECDIARLIASCEALPEECAHQLRLAPDLLAGARDAHTSSPAPWPPAE